MKRAIKFYLILLLTLGAIPLYSAPLEVTVDGFIQTETVTFVPITVGKISIVIPVGSGLPPDPGEEGDKTIQGVDSDDDGIRDDVEREISLKYPNDPEKRAYSYYIAMKFQELINEPEDRVINEKAVNEIYQAESCLVLLRREGEEIGSDFILPIVMNTYLRSKAYIKSLGLGAGEIRTTLGAKECGE